MEWKHAKLPVQKNLSSSTYRIENDAYCFLGFKNVFQAEAISLKHLLRTIVKLCFVVV